jgi:hypothetical protein
MRRESFDGHAPNNCDYTPDPDQNDPQRPGFSYRVNGAYAARDGISAAGNLRG